MEAPNKDEDYYVEFLLIVDQRNQYLTFFPIIDRPVKLPHHNQFERPPKSYQSTTTESTTVYILSPSTTALIAC